MSLKFNPTGYLNITADPMDLPEQSDGKNIVSGAMVRCKNLDLNYAGKARTRRGTDLASTSACSVDIDHIQVMDNYRYEFGSGSILRNETLINKGLGLGEWDSVVDSAYNDTEKSIFAVNGTERKRIQGSLVDSWGIEAPTVAPTTTGYVDYSVTLDWELDYVTVGYKFTTEDNCCFTWEQNELDGDTQINQSDETSTWYYEAEGISTTSLYQYKYTYCRKDGDLLLCESNPSPSGSVYIESVVYVTWENPTDTQITHVRVYRTLADFGDFYYADEFEINETFGVVVTKNEDLGSLVETDHDRPPAGTVLCGPDYNGVLFMGYGNLLYYSKPKQPEYWPALYNVKVGSDAYEIIGLALLSGQLYAATKHEIYQISGTGAETFFPLPMAAITGTFSGKVFLPIKGFGIIHLGYDGLYLYTGSSDVKISASFQSIWNNETLQGIPPINKNYIANCLIAKNENKLWFGYPGSSSQYCDNFIVIELESNMLQGITSKLQYYTYPWSVTDIVVDQNNKNMLAVDTDGYVRRLDVIDTTSDYGTIIPWEIESKEFGALRKYFPRWARYDVNLVNGANATGYVMLDGSIKQTHPITESRKIRKRLIDGCTGDRLSIRIAGTGPVEIYSAEIE